MFLLRFSIFLIFTPTYVHCQECIHGIQEHGSQISGEWRSGVKVFPKECQLFPIWVLNCHDGLLSFSLHVWHLSFLKTITFHKIIRSFPFLHALRSGFGVRVGLRWELRGFFLGGGGGEGGAENTASMNCLLRDC